jgi:hypothetical protein
VNIGTLTTNADVTDGANSNWAIELNGPLSDQLIVNGNIDLSAVDALNVSGSRGTSTSWLIGTYTGALTGVFNTVTSGYSVNYAGGNITLNFVGLSGDYNGDGKVDAADYVTWRKNPAGFGGSAGYDVWRQNFGTSAGTGLSETNSVPEPGTLMLVLAGVLKMWAGRRRR